MPARRLYAESGSMVHSGAVGGKVHYKDAKKIANDISKALRPFIAPISHALSQKATEKIQGLGRTKRTRKSHMTKGSPEAKAFMARVRAMKK